MSPLQHALIFGGACWFAASVIVGLCVAAFIREGKRDPWAGRPLPGSLGSSPAPELAEAEAERKAER